MNPENYSASEMANFQRLIEENHTSGLKHEEIRDSDILFFSQYGHLAGTGDDTEFQILKSFNEGDHSKTEENLTTISIAETTSEELSDQKPIASVTNMKYKEIDGKSTRVFECGICGKEFGHQYTLMRHLPTHTDERKFHCLTCGKAFRQMSTLHQHRAIHSVERPYVCEVCNKNFNRVSTLISHRKTHTGVKPHICHVCHKAFHQKGNLRNHVFTHTNERPYKCDICNKGFNQMSNLMCHKMKAHQQNDVFPRYTCKVCGEDFLKRVNLRQHEQFKHGMVDTISTKFDYSNAIIVDPIKTDAMRVALDSGETPFALLRPLSGIPVLVRVHPAGDKQMLVPATADDLKKYGHISIRPKVPEGSSLNETENKDDSGLKTPGCVVQIKVPVVATVIQRSNNIGNGTFSMSVVSPGPAEIVDEAGGSMADLNTNSFVYSSTLVGVQFAEAQNQENQKHEVEYMNAEKSGTFENKYDTLMASITDAEIEFVDQNEKDVKENDFQESLDINSMEFSFDMPRNTRIEPNDIEINTDKKIMVLEDDDTVEFHCIPIDSPQPHSAIKEEPKKVAVGRSLDIIELI